MFENQQRGQNVEDIFEDTDTGASPASPGAREPQPAREGAVSAAPPAQPFGPPSALATGRLAPKQAVPASGASSQFSTTEQGRRFPWRKMMITVVIVVVVGAGVGAGWWWWQQSDGGFLGGLLRGNENTPVIETPGTPVPTTTTPEPETTSPETSTPDTTTPPPLPSETGTQTPEATPLPPSTGLDTDLDGLEDDREATAGTNPSIADTDSDGLSDWEEVVVFGTNPLATDSDRDSYSDGQEVQNGYNPNGPGRLLEF